MYAFTCGSPVCKTHFTAPTMDALLAKLADHVVVKHRVAEPTRSLVNYVVANCVREVAPAGEGG
jgi:predicted small metal-binding protein